MLQLQRIVLLSVIFCTLAVDQGSSSEDPTPNTTIKPKGLRQPQPGRKAAKQKGKQQPKKGKPPQKGKQQPQPPKAKKLRKQQPQRIKDDFKQPNKTAPATNTGLIQISAHDCTKHHMLEEKTQFVGEVLELPRIYHSSVTACCDYCGHYR
jgi:hypothetical protein